MGWKLAPCLVQLRSEINAKYPGRDKASDGSIGDSAHSSRTSDHNPDARGIVHAVDIDKDLFPGSDAQINALVEKVANDPRVKYTIWRRRIKNPGGAWRKYSGSNPHDKHAHFSVTVAGENQTHTWLGTSPISKPAQPTTERLNAGQIKWLAQSVGIHEDELSLAAAIAYGESGGNPRAFNGKAPDASYGLWQINMHGVLGPARRKEFGLSSNEDLFDPATNARAMKAIRRSQGWKAWGAFTNQSYLRHLPEALEARPTPIPDVKIEDEEEEMALVLWAAEGSSETWGLIEGRPCMIRQGRDLDQLMAKYREAGAKIVDLGPKMTPDFQKEMLKGPASG